MLKGNAVQTTQAISLSQLKSKWRMCGQS